MSAFLSIFLRQMCRHLFVYIRNAHQVQNLQALKWHDCSCRAVVGELDDDLDKELDLGNTRAAPLKSIVHN